jgi:hypothetical protein
MTKNKTNIRNTGTYKKVSVGNMYPIYVTIKGKAFLKEKLKSSWALNPEKQGQIIYTNNLKPVKLGWFRDSLPRMAGNDNNDDEYNFFKN